MLPLPCPLDTQFELTHASFFYMAGADFAGCSVTYDIARDHLVLWIPYTNPRAVLWYGRTPSPKECIAAIDVDEVRYSTGLDKFLHATLRPGSTLYVLNEAQKPKLRRAEGEVHIDSRSLAPAIERARVTKTDYEVAMIRQANAVSVGPTQHLATPLSPCARDN